MIKIINVPNIEEVLAKFNDKKNKIWRTQLLLNEEFNKALNEICKASMDSVDAQETAVQAIAESNNKNLKKATKAQARAEKKLQKYKSLLQDLSLEIAKCQCAWGEALGKLEVIEDPNKILQF